MRIIWAVTWRRRLPAYRLPFVGERIGNLEKLEMQIIQYFL
jgi:hypothetical protein